MYFCLSFIHSKPKVWTIIESQNLIRSQLFRASNRLHFCYPFSHASVEYSPTLKETNPGDIPFSTELWFVGGRVFLSYINTFLRCLFNTLKRPQ